MEFELGTHLVTPRGYYTHHGIYIGNGVVIHYAGLSEGFKKDCIREATLQEFQNGKGVFVYKHEFLLRNQRHSSHEIVRRAKSRLGENKYRLLWNNCETFANWCTHGDAYSAQTEGKVERFFWQHASPYQAVMPPINPINKIIKIGRLVDKLFR